MATLRVNVNSYWFGLLDKGEIKFDYREVKPHWIKRLTTCDANETDLNVLNDNLRHFDEVEFYIPGHTRKIIFKLLWMSVFKGSEVGLKTDAAFIIKFGKRL